MFIVFIPIEGFSATTRCQILQEKHKTSFGILRIEILEKFQNPFELEILTYCNMTFQSCNFKLIFLIHFIKFK